VDRIGAVAAYDKVCNSRPSRSPVGSGSFFDQLTRTALRRTDPRCRSLPAELRIAQPPYSSGYGRDGSLLPARYAAAERRARSRPRITSIRVYCEGLYCPHWRVFTFDALAMPDELPVIHISRVRRFVCSKCGSRKVQARSIWPDRKPTGPFYSPSMSVKPKA
jgi:hypothetical protein